MLWYPLTLRWSCRHVRFEVSIPSSFTLLGVRTTDPRQTRSDACVFFCLFVFRLVVVTCRLTRSRFSRKETRCERLAERYTPWLPRWGSVCGNLVPTATSLVVVVVPWRASWLTNWFVGRPPDRTRELLDWSTKNLTDSINNLNNNLTLWKT